MRTIFFRLQFVLLVLLSLPGMKLKGAGVDFATTIQPIFTNYCTPCHEGSFQFDLSQGASYGNIVNVSGGKYSSYRIRPDFADTPIARSITSW